MIVQFGDTENRFAQLTVSMGSGKEQSYTYIYPMDASNAGQGLSGKRVMMYTLTPVLAGVIAWGLSGSVPLAGVSSILGVFLVVLVEYLLLTEVPVKQGAHGGDVRRLRKPRRED